MNLSSSCAGRGIAETVGAHRVSSDREHLHRVSLKGSRAGGGIDETVGTHRVSSDREHPHRVSLKGSQFSNLG